MNAANTTVPGSGGIGGAGIASIALQGAGSITSALMTWYGIKKQEEQYKEGLAQEEEKTANEKYEFGEQMKMKKGEESAQRANTLNQIKWKEQDEDFQKQQLLANRLLAMVNSKPQLQAAVFSKIAAQKQLNQPNDYAALNPIRR